MARRRYAKHVSYEERPELKAVLIKLLENLESNHDNITWFYTRSHDRLRCEANHGYFRLFLSHTVPSDHKDFRDSDVKGVTVGRCSEEYKLQVIDLEGRYGYRNIVEHYFPLADELFPLMKGVFDAISAGKQFDFSSDKKAGPGRAGAINDFAELMSRS